MNEVVELPDLDDLFFYELVQDGDWVKGVHYVAFRQTEWAAGIPDPPADLPTYQDWHPRLPTWWWWEESYRAPLENMLPNGWQYDHSTWFEDVERWMDEGHIQLIDYENLPPAILEDLTPYEGIEVGVDEGV